MHYENIIMYLIININQTSLLFILSKKNNIYKIKKVKQIFINKKKEKQVFIIILSIDVNSIILSI